MAAKIRIGSRGSKLALQQAQWVADEIRKKNPGVEIFFHTIMTTGDRDVSPSLQSIGGKGVFVKEIEDALLNNEIDLAVHSLKDLPQNLPSGLTLGPFPLREDPRDALVSRFGEELRELPKNSIVGTSSPRRQAQILHKYRKRNYQLEPIRGNIDTRLKKLANGDYDAVVMAAAGLKRIGLASEITQIIEPGEMMPAPGQGCLGLEIREDDKNLREILETVKDKASDITARAERAFLQGVGGDCMVPLGAFTVVQGSRLTMKAILLDPKGETAVEAEEEGGAETPELIGAKLAGRLVFEGSALL